MEKLIALDANILQFLSDRPEAITTEDISLQISVASHPDTPRNLLEILVNSDIAEVAEAASLHVNYAGELTDNWEEAIDEQLKSRYLGQNDRLAVELLKIAPVPAYFLSEYVPANYLIQGLNNPYLPLRYRLQLLTRLAQEPTLEPRLQVAESPDTPLPVLEQLIGGLELPIRIAVQYNPNCPSALVELVTGQHNVASNWDTDSEQLDNLSNSNWDWIRLAVAQNPSAAEETLLKLAADKVFKIQLAVAKNPVTSARVLSALAEHSNKEIQAAIAKHSNATEEILHGLFDTQHRVIKSRENLSASILERIYDRVDKNTALSPDRSTRSIYAALRSYLLGQPNTPTWILAEFAEIDLEKLTAEKLELENRKSSTTGIHKQWVSDELKFLIDLAQHPQVSVEILEAIIQYPNLKAKLAVAQNIKTPDELRLRLLEELLEDEKADKIKGEIAADVNTPTSILEKLAGQLSSISQVFTRLRQMIPSTSPSLINKIIDFIDRYQSPEQILFWLRQDPAFGDPILQDWQQLVDSLDELETLQLKAMSIIMMPAIGLSGGIPKRGRSWLNKGLDNSRINSTNLQDLPPTYSLYGLLMLIGVSYQSDSNSKAVVAALLGNPSTPVSTRDRLWERYREKSDDDRQVKDASLRLALGFNLAVDENQRQEHLEQALKSGYSSIREAIAKNPLTPADILEIIASRGVGGLQQVVKNPNCPVHLLQQTARQIENSSGLSHTLVEIAKNPNTPITLLKELALHKSAYGVIETVLKNPNLDRLTVYEIQLQVEEQKAIQQANQALAKRTDSPYALAKVLETGDQNAKLTAARNRKTPVSVLEQLAKDKDEIVRQTVAQNPNISLKIAEQLAQDTSSKVQLSLVRSKIELSPEILHRIVQTQNEFICKEVAKNKNTPAIILQYLASHKKYLVEVLKNPNTPIDILTEYIPQLTSEKQIESVLRGTDYTQQKNLNMPSEILEQLSHHQKDTIRYLVALYSNASVNTLRRLSGDSYPLVRKTVAENPNTPPEVLIEMAKDLQNQLNTTSGSFYSVAYKIAARKDAPAEALDYIARMPVSTVRIAAVRNENISLKTLEWLVNNESDENILSLVAQNHQITSQIQEKLASHPSVKVRQSLASNPNATSDTLTIIALTMITEETSLEVHQAVAFHPNTPVSFLENLSEASNSSIRAGVASNPHAPQDLIEKLAKDESVEVRRAVANNSHASQFVRDALQDLLLVAETTERSLSPTLRGLSRIYNPDTDDLPTVLSEYANSNVAFVRFVSLLHPLTPVEILQEGSQSVSWIERYAVADNSATPIEIEQQLARDGNRIVRAVAKAKLAA